jgi:hypothetical protein
VFTEQPDPDHSTPFDLGRAVSRWAHGLIDPTAANRLVYYRDLRAGTLDLTDADPQAVDRLLIGAAQTIGKLFPAASRPDALRRARTIRARMRDLAEERGLDAGYVAVGLATWTEPDRTPRAPVLLYALRIDPVTVAEHDFRLTVDPIPVLNPVLLHKLAREFGIEVDEDELVDEGADPAVDPEMVFAKLAKAADEVPGFQIAPTRLVGTFTYEKLPMVVDLDASAELLASSDPVAALAGDPAAAARLARAAESVIADPGGPGRPASGREGPAGHRQEPDDRQPDRGARRPWQDRALRGREAGRDRRRRRAPGRGWPR